MSRDEPIIVIAILGITIYLLINKNYENWKNYQLMPYGEGKEGSEPLTYYQYPRYRKPYRYPLCKNVNYPFPHCTPLD